MFTSAWFHAPTPCSLFASRLSPPSPNLQLHTNRFSMAVSVRIAVVGDVHDDWDLQEDTKALELLKPDLVLFTGDFGNENVELVRSIADLEFPKAVILGNHDAWSTRKFTDKKKDAVQLQLEWRNGTHFAKMPNVNQECHSQQVVPFCDYCNPFDVLCPRLRLGGEHVGYRRLDFPLLKLSVVGGRPFSCGGESMYRRTLLTARYGVHNINGSVERICRAALGAPVDHSVILLAHNGPTGLGSNMNDICGRDWYREGGDHGDPDLELAISQLKDKNKHSIPLVVFGHMHKELRYGNGPRKMMVVGDDNTIYLNGAIVPRVLKQDDELETSTSSSIKIETPLETLNTESSLRAFTVVDFVNGNLEKIAETWVSVIGEKTSVKEEHILFSAEPRLSELSI